MTWLSRLRRGAGARTVAAGLLLALGVGVAGTAEATQGGVPDYGNKIPWDTGEPFNVPCLPGSYHWSTELTVGRSHHVNQFGQSYLWGYTVFLSDPHHVGNYEVLYDHKATLDDVTIDYDRVDYDRVPYFVVGKLVLGEHLRSADTVVRGVGAL